MSLPLLPSKCSTSLPGNAGVRRAVERVVVRGADQRLDVRADVVAVDHRRAGERAAVVGDAVLGDDHARGRHVVVRAVQSRRRRGSRCGSSSGRSCRRACTCRRRPRRRRRWRSRAGRCRGRCRRRARRRRRPRRCGRRSRRRWAGRRGRGRSAWRRSRARGRRRALGLDVDVVELAGRRRGPATVPSAASSTVEACAVAGTAYSGGHAPRGGDCVGRSWVAASAATVPRPSRAPSRLRRQRELARPGAEAELEQRAPRRPSRRPARRRPSRARAA